MRTYYISSLFLLFFVPLNVLLAQDSISENSAKGISLKLDLQPNNSYRYLAKDTWNITQDTMGNSLEINQETIIGYKFKVASNTREGIKIEASFEEIRLDLELPQGSTTLDSKSNISTEFSQVLNKPFYISLNGHGKVIKIEGLEDIFRNLEGSGEVLLKDFFTLKNLTAFIESTFNIFPIDSVNMGDSWDRVHSQSLNNQFDLIFDKTYTLEGLSEDMAWLTVGNKIKSSASETFAFEVDSTDAKQEGIIEIDRDSGLILFSDIKHEHQGVIKHNGLETLVKISFESSLKGELVRN